MLLWERLTRPRGVERTPEAQRQVDEETRNLSLYQFRTCPFCMKTRRAIRRLSLQIETFDAQHDETAREALLKGGGSIKVPCLRIDNPDGETTWLYESDAIIGYLQNRFG